MWARYIANGDGRLGPLIVGLEISSDDPVGANESSKSDVAVPGPTVVVRSAVTFYLIYRYSPRDEHPASPNEFRPKGIANSVRGKNMSG